MKTLLLIVLTFTLTGCQGLRITGGIETDYGSVTSDGTTVHVKARLPDQTGLRK